MGLNLNVLLARIAQSLGMQGLQFNYTKRFAWTGCNVKDRNDLIDAILSAYDNPAYRPIIKEGKVVTTFCNMAANDIAQKMGCKDFYFEKEQRALTADEIYLLMHNRPDKWREIPCASLPPENREVAFGAIQFQANEGNLIFAAQSSFNLHAAHGHICVIRPGTMKTSGKWGRVPACMNIGGENFIALGQAGVLKGQPVGINEAFRELPRFFAWKGS